MAMDPVYAALLPLFILTGAGAILPLLGAFKVRAGWLAGLAAVAILAAGLASVGMLWEIPWLAGQLPQVGNGAAAVRSFGLLETTPFAILFNLVFLAVALMVALASPRYLERRHQGEFYSLILLSTVGMMVVAMSRDLLTLFVGLELSSFCTYALAGFFKRRVDSSEAAMKYFLVGSISSSLALFGISIVYGLTGSTTFESLNALWSVPVQDGNFGTVLMEGRSIPAVFAWVLLLAGFGYKIAMVPFHNYAVDVYEGSPSTVGGFLAAGSKQMGFAALFKVFLLGLLAVKANWDVMVGVLAIATMVVGNVVALSQTNIKRMLAYSSIAQAGYILMALAIGTDYALAGGLFHIVTYSFMKAGAFVALAAAATWGVGEELSDWKGMSRRAPLLAFAMAAFMLSFAGIPPLAGFASKFVLFSGAISAGGWYVALAVAGIVTSAVSLVYYWRVVRVMYVEESDGRRLAVSSSAWAAVLVALAGTILLGIFPEFAVSLSREAAQSLLPAAVTAATGG
ncbi:MAG TPA: NADH-quinone oxidoreductase subunit N [Candidatus Thermoplasmatota archaeon]|nr:NADH-quinone oxidoreductase subunit N [Candidatus Thermoplasmatota archaeon]